MYSQMLFKWKSQKSTLLLYDIVFRVHAKYQTGLKECKYENRRITPYKCMPNGQMRRFEENNDVKRKTKDWPVKTLSRILSFRVITIIYLMPKRYYEPCIYHFKMKTRRRHESYSGLIQFPP